jgi:hypothetical protein
MGGLAGAAGTGGTGTGGSGLLEGGPIVGFDSTCLTIAGTDGSVITDPVVVHRACDEPQPWHRDAEGRLLAGLKNAALESSSEAGDPGEVVRVSAPIVPAATTQQWDLTGVHLLANFSLCIDVFGEIFSDGTPVQIYPCRTGAAQEWTITPVGQIRHGDYCLDVPNGDMTDGTPLQIFKCYADPPDKQRFALVHGRIQPRNSGKCVSIAGGLTPYPAPLEIQTCAMTGDLVYAQAFALQGPIMNRGLCLDVSTPSIVGPVALKPCTGTAEQTWVWYF